MTETILDPRGPGLMVVTSSAPPASPIYLAAGTSTIWPVANLVMYYPISIDSPIAVAKMGWVNGTTVSATYHIDAGIYSDTPSGPGTKLASTTSTAQGTASVMQTAAVSYTLSAPARYYLAMTVDNILSTIWMRAAQGLGTCASMGICEETTGGFGLPSTATPILAAHEVFNQVIVSGASVI